MGADLAVGLVRESSNVLSLADNNTSVSKIQVQGHLVDSGIQQAEEKKTISWQKN